MHAQSYEKESISLFDSDSKVLRSCTVCFLALCVVYLRYVIGQVCYYVRVKLR